jgi:hypothetical protein
VQALMPKQFKKGPQAPLPDVFGAQMHGVIVST